MAFSGLSACASEYFIPLRFPVGPIVMILRNCQAKRISKFICDDSDSPAIYFNTI